MPTESIIALQEAIQRIGKRRPLRVLIVDDDKDDLELMRTALAPYLLIVDSANSGRQAETCARTSDYDVIFLDVKMQGQSGIETAKSVKEISPNSRILFVTGYPEFPGLSDALSLGVLQIIEKSAFGKAVSELFKHLCNRSTP
jgi:two-component system response regulator YesN